MSVSRDEPKSSLTRAQDLVRSIPTCDPAKSNAVGELRTDLQGLRTELRADGARVEDGLCELAGRMLAIIERHGSIGGREGMELVSEILGSVAESLGDCAPPIASTRRENEVTLSTTSSGEDSSLGLSLMDQRKLGEILVSLSMLTPDEVEDALKHQRTLGKRFGETLVELGILSKSSIDCALRMQRRYRGATALDPWMQSS